MSISNGDTNKIWCFEALDANNVSQPVTVRGLGSFHKSLPHNDFGEVDAAAFAALVSATRGDGSEFSHVSPGAPREIVERDDPCAPVTSGDHSSGEMASDKKPQSGPADADASGEAAVGKSPPASAVVATDEAMQKKYAFAAALTNPQAGLAEDRLTHHPSAYSMPPAPRVMSETTAAEMVELYWMALLRDEDLCKAGAFPPVAVTEVNDRFSQAINSLRDGESDRLKLGVDVPNDERGFKKFTAKTLFRLGLPGDNVGPMVSQFFLRPVAFGTQTIDQRQRPYASGLNYLTEFGDWLSAQNTGRDEVGQAYSGANEDHSCRYGPVQRYIATMRDLARFVNKDALHQAYFNAALVLLSGEAKWGLGNPYHDLGDGVVQGTLPDREAGFGVLGGPHLLALVSEIATRALKVVWQQKWQQHLRLRPEAYGGLVHVQHIGAKIGDKEFPRAYGLPEWLAKTTAASQIKAKYKTLLLPMAFTPGSPTHPAYGAGHATVAGACVTILKAWFLTFTSDATGKETPVLFARLKERVEPFGPKEAIEPKSTNLVGPNNLIPIHTDPNALTIEGELNKLAQNVAMGRSMGGVHWRTDNTRSLVLGEALAAEVLARITTDANEKPFFEFRTFARRADGQPRKVHIEGGRIYVDGVERAIPASSMI